MGISLLSLLPDDMDAVISASQELAWISMMLINMLLQAGMIWVLVSFDTDFRRTDRGCKAPSQIL